MIYGLFFFKIFFFFQILDWALAGHSKSNEACVLGWGWRVGVGAVYAVLKQTVNIIFLIC